MTFSVFLEAPTSRFRGLRESLFLALKLTDFVASQPVKESLNCHKCAIETLKQNTGVTCIGFWETCMVVVTL